MLKRWISLAFAAMSLTCTGALAVESAPDAPTPVDRLGQEILAFVAGRTYEEALGVTQNPYNPFNLDGESLLRAAGLYFIEPDTTRQVFEGTLSISPEFETPDRAFSAAEATPAIVPFAFVTEGSCHGGYVSGFPVADQVATVDMSSRVCSAQTVKDIVAAEYHAAAVTVEQPGAIPPIEEVPVKFDPANPTDYDLEMIVYIAYGAARDFALANDNYFVAPGGTFEPLRAAIVGRLEKEGYGAVELPTEPASSPEDARECAAPGRKTQLHVASPAGGAGLTLAAVTDTRMSAYDYDPDKGPDITVTTAQPCSGSGFGRSG